MVLAARTPAAALRPLASFVKNQTRLLQSSGPRRVSRGGVNVLHADEGKLGTKLYHGLNLVLIAGLPVAISTSPSSLTMPFDIVLGVALPLHAHIGMNYVISDYIPKPSRGSARNVMLAATLLAMLGLLKLNVTGPGMTETLKAVWRKPDKVADKDSKRDQK